MPHDDTRTSANGSRPRVRGLRLVLTLVLSLIPMNMLAIKINRPTKPLAGHPLPSGYIPPGCGTDPITSPMLLDCWLNGFPYGKPGHDIALSIRWEVAPNQEVPWAQWEDWRKQDLRQAFLAAWKWHQGGFSSYSGTPLPDPLPNQQVLADADGPTTLLDENTEAWPMFIATIAQSLAAEIGGWVPWSLREYDKQQDFESLQDLLSGSKMFRRPSLNPNDYYYSPTPGLWPRDFSLPAHPTVTFAFLHTHGLIAPTQYQTVGRVLDWSRNLAHYFGGASALNMEYHWAYRGLPPVSRVLSGTLLTDPQYAGQFPDPEHWTAGCYGTSAFLQSLLRAINIPVDTLSGSADTCYHTMPYFRTLHMYLSHGDDPYTLADRQATYPAEQLLISEGTWKAWFQSGDADTSCSNVGRRPTELAVWNFSPPLYVGYCSDVATNKDHASGYVYTVFFQQTFTVQQLEATNLWGRLDAAVQAAGGCANFPNP